ncbi:MAG TPA: histidine kinase [Peptococcaceae bacterium]|nr:histidine kinase [Peptococcaceae bacterium]
MSDLTNILLTEQLNNFQLQRHDFLNNFQVIKGYLQMDMPQKALEYLDEVILELRTQQEIYKLGQKTLLAIFMSWYFRLRLQGVEMTVSFPPEMKKEEFWQGRWQEEYAEEFYGYTRECADSIPAHEKPENLLAKITLKTLPAGFECNYQLVKMEEILLEKIFSTPSLP